MPNPINPQVPWSPPPHIQPGLSTQEYSLDYAPPGRHSAGAPAPAILCRSAGSAPPKIRSAIPWPWQRQGSCSRLPIRPKWHESKQAAKEMIKAAELAGVASRFKWTEEASLELLAFVKMIKEEYDKLSVKQPGFTKFSKYFLQNDNCKDKFPLLIKIENDTMIRHYWVLMNTFRVCTWFFILSV
ncbi:hypothetical protein VP01_9122g1 [Puccinia sorghi]|uniref:Uncharacterized protein n=1 Tax=Puccinia sorghi TaxID=27349 RepID=A0A0L6U857_9BASI|nr:hypothetical protein VP01_9122g1 [Puccinia sorghi]